MESGDTNTAEQPAHASRVVVERPLGSVDTSFYIIGVGASAGGLEAIRQLISTIPPDFPHSLSIIQHISPDYKSMMSEILGRETDLRVVEVEDDMVVQPRHIYLIPPKSNIVIQGTSSKTAEVREQAGPDQPKGLRFSLVEPAPRPGLNLPIDQFFHSLAEAVGDRSIAIVLSGTGSDGSRGIRSIKDHGGLVLCQSTETAEFDGMPRAAMATGIVDLPVPPDTMVPEILRYLEMRQNGVLNVSSLFEEDESLFRRLLRQVSAHSEIDFLQYKEPTLKRRIARRVALCGFKTLEEYVAFAENDPDEFPLLHREFLVAVTNFFRDAPNWEEVYDQVLPQLFHDDDSELPVKIWCVGCSTGEEPYSIAMMVEEWRRAHGKLRDFRVLATDVSDQSIAIAKEGIYPETALEEIPERFHGKGFFSIRNGTLNISEGVRNRVLFSVHNAVDDTPFINTDLVICRNLLIYLGAELQNKLLTLFSFSLKPNGFLFLGAAETVNKADGVFAPFQERNRLYQNTGRDRARMGVASNYGRTFVGNLPRNRRLPMRGSQMPSQHLGKLLRTVLSRLGTCLILVDEGGRVIETYGDHKQYLRLPDEAFTPNILELVDDQLRPGIALVLRRAETQTAQAETNLKISDHEAIFQLLLRCEEVDWEHERHVYAITIQRSHLFDLPEGADEEQATARNWTENDQAYVLKLEADLATAQEMLASSYEDLGASNEELQAANEELQATNEELQANNEEIQSVNEELHTVNAENAERIRQLEAANADIQNLLEDEQVAKILLDKDLCIRRFTRGFQHYVKVRPVDLGRPLRNFSSELQPGIFASILDEAQNASTNGDTHSREVETADGRWLIVRTEPFIDGNGARDGAVITLIDVSGIKALEQEVRDQRDRLEGLLEDEASGYWDWNIATQSGYLSPRFKAMFGYAEHELENSAKGWGAVIHPEDREKVAVLFDSNADASVGPPFNQEVRYLHRNGSVVWVLCRGRIIERGEGGVPVRMMGLHVDITQLKRREDEVRRRAEEVRRFAFIAAHDLLQPMNTISNGVDALNEDLPSDLAGENRKVLSFLTSATERMRVRIAGVLDYAKLQDEELELQRLDLRQICDDVIEDMGDMVLDAGAELQIEPLPRAMGTGHLVARVILNILSNSLKYRSKTAPLVIRIDAIPAEPGFVAVRIMDNGIGIDPEKRELVFELFTRLHTDSEYLGNGLGLALCDRIVGQLGGKIWIEDGIDGGTAFIFTLPDAESTE